MAPVVHGLEQRYGGEIGFVYLDVDDPAVDPFKRQLAYRAMPAYVLLDGEGNPLTRWVGIVSEASFVSAFDALLAGQPIPSS